MCVYRETSVPVYPSLLMVILGHVSTVESTNILAYLTNQDISKVLGMLL